MSLRDLTLADALCVASQMRDEDRACVRAIRGGFDDEAFAVDRWNTSGPAWTLLEDGQPAAIGGLSFSTPWIGVLWLVARPNLRRESWRKLIRKARTVIAIAGDPACEHYRHRIEAHVLLGWDGAQRFADRLGLQLEGTRVAVGSAGESINVWVRLGPPKEN